MSGERAPRHAIAVEHFDGAATHQAAPAARGDQGRNLLAAGLVGGGVGDFDVPADSGGHGRLLSLRRETEREFAISPFRR